MSAELESLPGVSRFAEMGLVRSGAKRAVLQVVVIAALPWAFFIGAVLAFALPSPVALAIGFFDAVLLVLFYPERVIAERVYRSLVSSVAGTTSDRLRNIADGLAIAVGVPADRVAVIDKPVPNVLALPTKSHGLVVVATDGAVQLLTRPELEALVASQLVVAGDPWVRRATRAQLAQGPWGLLLAMTIAIGLPNPLFFALAFASVFVFIFTALYRRADAVRDLVADSVAIHTTKNPAALVSALRDLRPAVLVAPTQKLGSIGMLTDPFAVLSVRSKASSTVTVNGKSRSWSTEDELATELGFRAERMEHVTRGSFEVLDSLGPFYAAWTALGKPDNPYQLTDAERRVAVAKSTSPGQSS